MSRTHRSTPAELAPAPWPDNPTDDAAAEVARLFTRALRDGIGDRSLRAVARDAGIDHATLLRVLAGSVWPDLITVARLEYALECDLWPVRSPSKVDSTDD